VTVGLRVIALLAATAAAQASAAAPPSGLLGTWDVVRVEVDRADQMHWEVQPQDPELLYRELVIGKTETHFAADKETCKEPSWKPSAMTWGELFGKGFQRPEGGGRSTKPTPKDFELDVESRDKATAYTLCRNKKLKGSKVWLEAEWVVLPATDTLVVHQDPQVLLVLKRRAADARPRASFACEKAVSPTEKAICSSFELAGWDRSVADAYTQALKRNASTQDKILADQKDWLRKRDACGDKTSCIDDLLWRRVDDLKQY